jgi:hypothetical protein
VVENGWWNVASPGQKSYRAVVSVGGTQRYDSGVTNLEHLHHTRWSRVDWVGTDPGITPQHNGAYMRSTKLVANYSYTAPAESAYTGLTTAENSTPFTQGNWPGTMGDAGTSGNVGNRWDALYYMTGDARAYRATMGNARAAGRYGLYYRDETTGLPVDPSTYATWGINLTLAGMKTGAGNGTTNTPTATGTAPPQYAFTHAPTLHYHAGLLSGRYSFAEAAHFTAITHHFLLPYTTRQSATGIIPSSVGATETRAVAWGIRELGQAINLLSLGAGRTRLQTILAANATYYDTNYTDQNSIGMPLTYLSGGTTPVTHPMWMADLWTNGWGFTALSEPLTDNAALTRAAKFFAKATVGRVGTGATTEWCYRRAAYGGYVAISTASYSSTIAQFNAGCYTTFGQLFTNANGTVNGDCALNSTLLGTSGANPAEWSTDENNYWALLGIGLAHAVDLGVTGASDGWARVTGASNYSTSTATLKNLPGNAVTPRT